MAVSTLSNKDIKVVNYTGWTTSISANNTVTKTDIDFSSVVPSGYEAFEFTCGATGDSRVFAYNCLLNGSGRGQAQLRNTSSSAFSITPQFRVWCKRL